MECARLDKAELELRFFHEDFSIGIYNKFYEQLGEISKEKLLELIYNHFVTRDYGK